MAEDAAPRRSGKGRKRRRRNPEESQTVSSDEEESSEDEEIVIRTNIGAQSSMPLSSNAGWDQDSIEANGHTENADIQIPNPQEAVSREDDSSEQPSKPEEPVPAVKEDEKENRADGDIEPEQIGPDIRKRRRTGRRLASAAKRQKRGSPGDARKEDSKALSEGLPLGF